ncbi:efflux RND transporter periplasmic adaptor subunit [Rhodobacter ferrooxidans]|uniref:Efflux transporter, RND family, MFP subunit n=1 Tax=Rhodobacter ferrooxidans TaxID=371731 RepID=C8S4U7_9RHOB|nr:efflux RND transporter periplasmic adaptor subunit [Rhodobacter sp. SW2]EEW24006.1 efflux transporter, RND family, MFP subunit [Rhodobacter sp. SW2]
MRKAWIAGAVALVLAGGVYGWTLWRADTATAVPATVAVTLGTVEKTVLASGVIEAASLVSVGARVSGLVETLAVSLGQQVQAGDLIAQIDSMNQQNAVLQAEADLAQIEADIVAKDASIHAAQLVYDRALNLNEKNLSSTESLEAAQAALAVDKAGMLSLQAKKARAEVTIASARLELQRTKITAPIAGTIVAIVTSAGQTVNAVQAAPVIVKIAVLDRMVVKADISEADVVQVAPGQGVSFTLLGEPDVAYAATVRAIEPAPASIKDSDEIATDQAIYYKGLFDVDNPEGKLRIGMTAQVSILIDRAEGVPLILSSQLGPLESDGRHVVQVYDPATGTTTARAVRVGLNNNIQAEIREGLKVGELVAAPSSTTVAPTSTRNGPPMAL